MSSTISPDLSSVPTGTLGRLASDSASIKARLDQLTTQASTGLVSETYGGLGSLAKVSLDLRPQIAQAKTFTQNITAATTNITLTTNVLNQLQQIATSFYTDLTGVDVQTATGVASLATQAASALTEVQTLLNTEVGQNYLLAGQDSANPPAPNATFDAYVQSVQAAASGLPTSTGTATAAATLAAANATSPFSATLTPAATQVPVSDGQTVAIGVVAGQNATAVQTGPTTTGSYVRDLIRSLATISTFTPGSMNFGQNFTDLVSDTTTSLQGAMTAITGDVSGMGAVQQQLTATQTGLTDSQTALTNQVSTVENADTATTLTALSQTQTQLQMSYQLIAQMETLSLANYL